MKPSEHNCTLNADSRLRRAPGLAFLLFTLVVLALALAPATPAQESPPGEGVVSGNYNIKQSFELGYRWTDFTGNLFTYGTFVDLNQGPRMLEHTLEMRSLNHAGSFFDDFYLHSFGYGGDPNNLTRLRMNKNRWYSFTGTFRRNRNFWDYNLLANPLNPPTSNPAVPIVNSPHRFEMTRRNTDLNLIVLPQSPVRFRLGYGRNIMEGPSFNTPHFGTEVIAFVPWLTTLDSYRFGVDFRGLPKTNISYDQFWHYFKGDNRWELVDFPQQLSDGTPVNLGVIWNTGANQPCAAPITVGTTTPPTANATCNGFLSYRLFMPIRVRYPTEQLSFQTSYFRNLDLSGRFIYNSSRNRVPVFEEFYAGRTTRTNLREATINASASGRRLSATGDFGATITVNDKFRIVDTFRFHNFRIPGLWESDELNFFGTSMLLPPNLFNPATCPSTSSTCPQHTTSSPADVISALASTFLQQDTKTNQFELLYDPWRRFGGRLGYRYSHRTIRQNVTELDDLLFYPTLPNRGACAGVPLNADGSCSVTTIATHEEETKINEHSLLFGVWARPVDAVRLGFDMELFGADRSFTRISPRQFQLYRLRATVRPSDWSTINAAVYILERRNNVAEIEHRQHDRTFSVSGMFFPNDRFSFDFGYDFNDVLSLTNICFAGTVRPPGTSPCPTALALFQQVSIYDHDAQNGHVAIRFKPVQRFTANIGYLVTSTTGTTLILSPDVPSGPLRYTYYAPSAGFEVELNKHVFWKTQWGYYGYNERALPDPTTRNRDFRGNLVTISGRFLF